MNEEFYIEDLHKGDEKVFRAIFEKYHTRLCYFASTLLSDTAAPEDVVQDTFVKLWQKRLHFPDEQSVKAFLYITVKNHCLNIYKHDKVARKYADLLPVDHESESSGNSIVEAEVLENIHFALQKLPSGCRNIMQLSYFQGMRNKDIARYLDVSLNTVKTQKKRGLHLLRTILKVTTMWL